MYYRKYFEGDVDGATTETAKVTFGACTTEYSVYVNQSRIIGHALEEVLRDAGMNAFFDDEQFILYPNANEQFGIGVIKQAQLTFSLIMFSADSPYILIQNSSAGVGYQQFNSDALGSYRFYITIIGEPTGLLSISMGTYSQPSSVSYNSFCIGYGKDIRNNKRTGYLRFGSFTDDITLCPRYVEDNTLVDGIAYNTAISFSTLSVSGETNALVLINAFSKSGYLTLDNCYLGCSALTRGQFYMINGTEYYYPVPLLLIKCPSKIGDIRDPVNNENKEDNEQDYSDVAPAFEHMNWDYTLLPNKIIQLDKYKGTAEDVIVYAHYKIDGRIFKAHLSQGSSSAGNTFQNTRIKSITFTDSFDTDNLTSLSHMFYNCTSVIHIDLGANFYAGNVSYFSSMFRNCSSLKTLNLKSLNTENAADMRQMFEGCSSLETLDLSNFNTHNVTSMLNMFKDCASLSSLSFGDNFNTAGITSFSNLFSNCASLTDIDLSNFNTEQIEDMNNMFDGCCSLKKLDLSNFNAGKVTRMISMFSQCSALSEINFGSNFNANSITTATNMFSGCSSLTSLDLCGFNTTRVTNMSGMFYGCSMLSTIYVTRGKWSTPSSSNGSMNMFGNCGTSSVTYKE